MANAFGSITIVDMTDVGQFTTVPMSNAGLVIIYDPNALSNNYTPASMTLTPFTMYGGVDYSANQNVSYSWYKRADGASINYSNPGTATSTSSSVSVSSTDFTSANAKSLTYYLKATCQLTGVGNIVAWGQITISLVTQATNIQDIEINGEQIFKYKYTSYGASPTIDGDDSIVLTANYTSNIAVHQWYYHKKTVTSGTTTWSWETLPISGNNKVIISGNTCTVDHDAPIFYDNKAKIKVTAHRRDATSTELTSVYDEFEILKLYDGPVGAPGEKSVAIIVSNEDQMIPCDGNGNPAPDVTTAFSLASTTIEVLEGNNNITTNNVSTGYAVIATPNGVTSTNGIQYDSSNHKYTYKVDGWASNNSSSQGYVTFTATRTGYPTLSKTMSLTKIQTGEDGKTPTVYELSISPNRVTTNSDGNTTSQVVLTASVNAHTVNPQTSAAVDTNVTTSSSDVIYYEWYKDGSIVTSASGTGPNNKNVYTISNNTSVSSVVCKIRRTTSSGVILDSQSVAFVAEGAQGETGATGDAAITLAFPQSTDTIGLNNDGTLANTYVLEMPYTVYQGTTTLSAQAVNTVAKGYSFKINSLDFTGNNKGTITFGSSKVTITIPSGVKVYDSTLTGSNAHTLNGQCTIPIDYSGATHTAADGTTSSVSGTVLATFSWNLDVTPASGTSITISDTWTRYRQTNSATQPTNISKSGDQSTIAAAITVGGLSKPYYVWGRTHIDYSPSGSADTYTVNFYPEDPTDGLSVQTTTDKKYACVAASVSNAGINPPSSGWNASKTTAIGSIAKPYYVWERNVVSYKYSDNSSAGPDTTTYSVSYYPEDKVELTLQANSTIFNGVINTITITPIVTKNGTSYTPTTAELTWSYILNGTMTTVTSTSTSANIYRVDASSPASHQLVVKPGAVNGGTSIQCRLITSNQTIYTYLPLEDKTDEFRCELYSTVGDKLTNGQGSGFVECLLYRNGYEIDKITTDPIVTSARVPSGQTSPHAAIISIATEMDADASDKPDNIKDINAISYSWDYQQVDNNGELQPLSDSTYNSTGKAIYIDGSMINKKIMIGCTVEVTYITQPT